MPKRNFLVAESGYGNKYPVLGPMKIASYHRPNSCGDESNS